MPNPVGRPRKPELKSAIVRICVELPEGWQLDLNMERGAVGVRLYDEDLNYITLPDSADKTLAEQLLEALVVAKDEVKVMEKSLTLAIDSKLPLP